MKKLVTSAIVASIISTGALAGEGHSHWGYQGKDGPEYWGDLNAQFTTCKTGNTQSPININFDTLPKGEMGDIKFIY